MAERAQGLLDEIESKREDRFSHQVLLYSQNQLTSAVAEAKTVNSLIDQSKWKMRELRR